MGKGDPMDVGALSYHEDSGERERYTVAEVMEWLQQTGGEDYPPPPVPDASWEKPDNHLDAMAKGKGTKGKGFSEGGGHFVGEGGPICCERTHTTIDLP